MTFRICNWKDAELSGKSVSFDAITQLLSDSTAEPYDSVFLFLDGTVMKVSMWYCSS